MRAIPFEAIGTSKKLFPVKPLAEKQWLDLNQKDAPMPAIPVFFVSIGLNSRNFGLEIACQPLEEEKGGHLQWAAAMKHMHLQKIMTPLLPAVHRRLTGEA